MGMLEIRGLSEVQKWDYENGYHWFSDKSRLLKALAQYELYKRIVNLPGDVLEFGVYKGASLIRFLTFRHLLEAEGSREVVGFDAFGGFPQSPQNTVADKRFIEEFQGDGGDGLKEMELEEILQHKSFSNFALIGGDVFSTLPKWLASNPHKRVALAHFDMDVFAPTKFCLGEIWERVVPGGVFIFDDFGTVEGETLAVEEFVSEKGLALEKLPMYKVPAFAVKK